MSNFDRGSTQKLDLIFIDIAFKFYQKIFLNDHTLFNGMWKFKGN